MMKLLIHTSNVDLSLRLRKFIETRIGSLDKIIPHAQSRDRQPEARIELAKTNEIGRSGEMYAVEANIRVPGKIIRATSKKQDVMTAIVDVKETLYLELKKYKEAHITKIRRGQRKWKELLNSSELALNKKE